MTAPYDLEYVDSVNKYVDAYKIGSGDINWLEIINKISKKKKTSNSRHRCIHFKRS